MKQIDWMQWGRKVVYMIREILKDDLDGLLRLYMQLHNNPMPEKTAELLQIWDNIFNDKI